MRITYLANGSFVAGEGVIEGPENIPTVWLADDDTRTITLNWSDLLSSLTTTSATATRATVSSSFNGTTQTLTLSGITGQGGYVEATASDGTQTITRRICVNERYQERYRDYQTAWRY